MSTQWMTLERIVKIVEAHPPDAKMSWRGTDDPSDATGVVDHRFARYTGPDANQLQFVEGESDCWTLLCIHADGSDDPDATTHTAENFLRWLRPLAARRPQALLARYDGQQTQAVAFYTCPTVSTSANEFYIVGSTAARCMNKFAEEAERVKMVGFGDVKTVHPDMTLDQFSFVFKLALTFDGQRNIDAKVNQLLRGDVTLYRAGSTWYHCRAALFVVYPGLEDLSAEGLKRIFRDIDRGGKGCVFIGPADTDKLAVFRAPLGQ